MLLRKTCIISFSNFRKLHGCTLIFFYLFFGSKRRDIDTLLFHQKWFACDLICHKPTPKKKNIQKKNQMSEHPTSIDLTTPRPPPDPVDGASAPVPAGEVTPEHDMVPRCGVCLCDVVETGTGADTATWYPCCRAATHIQCMVQCAGLHGSCPNCRAPLTDWITPSELERACSVAGVPTEPVPTTPRDHTHHCERLCRPNLFHGGSPRATAPEGHPGSVLEPAGSPGHGFL